ncbi:CRISPR-associated endonuclease Cas1 [Parathermosynechococcus lividus]
MTQTLYLSRQGCQVSLDAEYITVFHQKKLIQQVQLPLIDLILIFGYSQLTTQLIRACLQRSITIAYLSKSGYCYGRLLPLQRSHPTFMRLQAQLSDAQKLFAAQQLIHAKLRNSRVILMRQQRRRPHPTLELSINCLDVLAKRSLESHTLQTLQGIEGSGARHYYDALAECFQHPQLSFQGRSRRPPGNEINALLSFGYQVLWNHLLGIVENLGLDPYAGCLHQHHHNHAALVSDLLEPFRAPIIDSLVLQLVNRRLIRPEDDFRFEAGGCFLNEHGRQRFLKHFIQRMEQQTQEEPFWHVLARQVRAFCQWLRCPDHLWCYRIN